MVTERVQIQIDRLLDEAGEAITNEDWPAVSSRARSVLTMDPGNGDTTAYLAEARLTTVPSGPGPAATTRIPLLQRNEPGDHEKATALLNESLAISTELGMRPLMERVLSRRYILKE